MLDIIINFGTGFLGLLIYATYNTRSYLIERTFNIKTGWKENWKRGSWVLIMVLLLSITYRILPEVFSQMGGLDGFKVPVTIEKGSFFGIAILLSKSVKLLVKKNI